MYLWIYSYFIFLSAVTGLKLLVYLFSFVYFLSLCSYSYITAFIVKRSAVVKWETTSLQANVEKVQREKRNRVNTLL